MDIPDGCAVAAVDFNVHLGMMNGSIFMKGAAWSGFHAPDRATTYEPLRWEADSGHQHRLPR